MCDPSPGLPPWRRETECDDDVTPGEREAEGGGDGQVKRLDLLPGSSTCHTAKWFP